MNTHSKATGFKWYWTACCIIIGLNWMVPPVAAVAISRRCDCVPSPLTKSRTTGGHGPTQKRKSDWDKRRNNGIYLMQWNGLEFVAHIGWLFATGKHQIPFDFIFFLFISSISSNLWSKYNDNLATDLIPSIDASHWSWYTLPVIC